MIRKKEMSMFKKTLICLTATILALGSVAGCSENKKTTKVKVEGPERKAELKIEKKEKTEN